MTDICEHTYEKYGHTGGYIFSSDEELKEPPRIPLMNIFKCTRCGERKTEPASQEELDAAREKCRLSNQLYRPWHDIDKLMEGLSGYELMSKLEDIQRTYPDHVHLAGIDDDHFSSSTIMFVEHRNEKLYWGTTAVVVPQCTGEEPLRFFMYPGHLQSVLEALAAIQRHDLPGASGEAWDSTWYEAEERAEVENHWVVVRRHHVRPDVTRRDLDADVEIAALREQLRQARLDHAYAHRALYDLAVTDDDAPYEEHPVEELVQIIQERLRNPADTN